MRLYMYVPWLHHIRKCNKVVRKRIIIIVANANLTVHVLRRNMFSRSHIALPAQV